MSLFEAVLVMMIAVPLAQQGVRLAQHYIRAQAGVQESRLLTQVVTAASTYALRDLNALVTHRGDDTIQRLTLSQLAADGAWVGDGAVRTALGRDIQVIFYDTGFKTLVVLAQAMMPTGKNSKPYVPRGGEGIGLVGTIREDAPNMLRGPGLDYNLDALLAKPWPQNGGRPPAVGDQMAIAVLRMDQDVLPFLHRKKVEGRPEANRMETDLDMDKVDLVGVGELIAQTISVTNAMDVGELTGTLKVEGNIKAGGDLDIPGTLTSAAAAIGGQVSTPNMVVTGAITVDTIETSTLKATSTFDVIDAVTVTGNVSAENLAADNLVANKITVSETATLGALRAGDVTSSTKLVAGTVVVNDELLLKKGCKGC